MNVLRHRKKLGWYPPVNVSNNFYWQVKTCDIREVTASATVKSWEALQIPTNTDHDCITDNGHLVNTDTSVVPEFQLTGFDCILLNKNLAAMETTRKAPL